MKEKGVIFVLTKNGKILMQQRDGNCKKFPFMWCLPGGVSEVGEDSFQTLLREVKEEYAIELEAGQCRFGLDYNSGLDKVYICDLKENQEPKLCEGFAMQWMNIDEIENMELGFNQNNLIPLLKKQLTI
jgi:8-oxo-dGTP pyrophosphatase MutT (NUDIX family)